MGLFNDTHANGSLATVDRASEVVSDGSTMMQVKSTYATAIKVQNPRELIKVQKNLLTEAALAGESFYYGWGAGSERIEGPSIDLAMAAARCWGNCAIELQPIHETKDAWIFTAVFVDLETGFTAPRQFRQSKKSVVHGKHDNERKDDMRFQIGQSKAIRNATINALPGWLIDKALNAAKDGVRATIEEFIKAKGRPAATERIVKALAKVGVKPENILAKFDIEDLCDLTIDQLVILNGDATAISVGQEYASTLFPGMTPEGGAKARTSSLNEKLSTAGSSTPVGTKGHVGPDKTEELDAETTPGGPPHSSDSEVDQNLTAELQDALEGVQKRDINGIEKRFTDRTENEATRNAIGGMCLAKREELAS